jgi:hypothetical protein
MTAIRSLAAAGLLLAALPFTAFAGQNHGTPTVPPKQAHQLPAAAGSPVPVFSFGISGGSLRPWSIDLLLDGSIAGNDISAANQHLVDARNTLKGLMALADGEGFFSLSTQIGCKGSGAAGPDASAHTITIHTATVTRQVSVYGSCKGKFTQLFAVLSAVAGVAR